MEKKKMGWYPVKELKTKRYRVCYFFNGVVQYTVMKDYDTEEEAKKACEEKATRVIQP